MSNCNLKERNIGAVTEKVKLYKLNITPVFLGFEATFSNLRAKDNCYT